jgi:hypothetical protein
LKSVKAKSMNEYGACEKTGDGQCAASRRVPIK